MVDYKVNVVDHSEDPFTYFVLFSYSNPIIFKDVVKELKWQNAMDDEIKAIEKNET